MKIELSNGILKISQKSSIQNILYNFGLLDSHAMQTPITKGLQLPMSKRDEDWLYHIMKCWVQSWI